jgi:hypothetical protein
VAGKAGKARGSTSSRSTSRSTSSRRSWARSSSSLPSRTAQDASSSREGAYTGIRRTWARVAAHFKRTYRRRSSATIAMGGYYVPDKPIDRPHPGGQAYRSWKHGHEPVANAVILYMMDVSGSMGDEQKEIVRIESFWIDTWLRSSTRASRAATSSTTHGARGRPRDLLPHAGERRHHDLERVQALLRKIIDERLPAGGVEHLPVPLLGRRQLVHRRHRCSACSS